ncbi:RHS repeat-associated core domain-containing protein [Paenibacillus tyrfis]|uniref:RHS repeat-associated core domain-containing protein n=1 Tax=Paenibacillus tyrfis TaxID=1501230 RepID=UPI000B591E6F|nr:RHS repeat-associated core domain-containing protein [Paenibacillus tyrfis]
MNKARFRKILTLALIGTLLLPNLPFANKATWASASVNAQEQPMNGTAESRKQHLISTYLISAEDIQTLLDQGYTLDDLETTLQERKETGINDLKSSLNKVRPRPINNSKEAKSIIRSEVTTVTYADVRTRALALANATDPTIPSYSFVQTKPDEAPYTVRLDQETISTLSGSLSLKAADLSLPGRNGLSFTLSRMYDSGSSQFGQMVTYGSDNGTIKPSEETLFPIGKGWSWNLSYLDIGTDSMFLHLAGSGVFKIKNDTLIGYPWKDLTFGTDVSVTVNGISSSYVLKSIHGTNQYFDAKGRLLQITDAYNNTVKFSYNTDPTYGSVLSTITDAIGNTISIVYSTGSVVLTSGNRKVTYYKTIQNEKELLTQVVDSLGRATTYDYDIKNAQFNLMGKSPSFYNAYALLTGVTHPTGVKTVYTYESTPVTRYIGLNAVNEVYRIQAREDQVTLSNQSVERYNQKNISYPTSDIGSSWDADMSFSVTVHDGLVQTTFTNKKDYIAEDQPAVFYNTNVTAIAGIYKTSTDYTYDEARHWPEPVGTATTKTNMQTGATSETVTSSTLYDDYGNVLRSTDPMGVTTIQGYDDNTHLLKNVTAPISPSQTLYTELERNAQGSITISRARDGGPNGTILQETLYENRDGYGNPQTTKIRKDAATYASWQTEYSAAYQGAFPTKQVFTVTDADNNTSTITKQYEYDALTGKLTKYTDGLSNSTTYQYDASGRVTKATHPDHSSIAVAYNDYTNQIQMTDETGVQTVTKWTPLGWKDQSGVIEGGIYKKKTQYRYDNNGRLLSVEDALGNKTQYGYDEWSRQNRISYPDMAVASVLYDDIGVTVGSEKLTTKTAIDPEGYAVKEYYDKLGRTRIKEETKKINGGTQTNTLATFTYDNTGKVRSLTDSLAPANVTNYGYDVLGHLTSVQNAKNEITSYTYDGFGRMTQIKYPDGKTMDKKYDNLGRLIQTIDPNQKAEKYYYDANDNQVGLKDRNGNQYKYTHDQRNFLRKKEIVNAAGQPLAGEEAITFTYDPAGRRTAMTDVTGTTSYAYSSSTGVLTQVTYPDGKSIRYDYDATGNRFVMNDPFGVSTYYHYDARNRLDTVGPSIDFANDYDAKYQYYGNDLLKQTLQRNDVASVYEYNGMQLKSLQINHSNGQVLNSYQYTYDNNGNQKAKTEDGSYYTFSYDELNRIKTSSQFNEAYGYDSRGNRETMQTNSPYDSPGSAYGYDKRDRLTRVTTTDNRTVTYKYNGDGLLWERTENDQTTRYYWDGDQIIAEAAVSGGAVSLKARYVRGKGLVAREDSQGKAYYLHNGHGDVVELRDSTGNTRLNSYNYDIWGNLASQSENIVQPFKYSGELWDNTTGLQYLRARWYDPSMGRFINKDTYEGDIANPLSLNLYTYVKNNPLKYVDHSGHWNQSIAANWTINEMKWMWEESEYRSDQTFWEASAYELRNQLRNAGYSGSDIMQSSDPSISRAEVMKMARNEHPILAFIADFTNAAVSYWESGTPLLGAARSAAMKAAGAASTVAKTGTVWDTLQATQGAISGTAVPRSFVLSGLKIGEKELWVHGNATKHMGEYLNTIQLPKQRDIASQSMLKSFRAAVEEAIPSLQEGRNFITVGGWELGIDSTDGIIYHAMMLMK